MTFKKQYSTKEIIKTFSRIKSSQAERMKKIQPSGINSLSPENTGFWIQQAASGRDEPIKTSELPEPIETKHMPAIRNGKINWQDFNEYLQGQAKDRGVFYDPVRAKQLLKRRDWQAMTATDEPWTFYPLILNRTAEILNSL